MFFRPKRPLTKFCERVSLRMIGKAAEADPSVMRSEFDTGATWMRDAKHPKRSTIIQMIILRMAADFWNHTNKITDDPDWKVSSNPFSSTNSDVVVAEALIFFFYTFIKQFIDDNELRASDGEAIGTAGVIISDIIQSNLQISIPEFFRSRMGEYESRDESQNPVEVFSSVVVRSIGKQAINDPDRAISLTMGDFEMPVMIRTAIFMKAMLPSYVKVYKNIVEHYPMD
jgi:hypothetical protein